MGTTARSYGNSRLISSSRTSRVNGLVIVPIGTHSLGRLLMWVMAHGTRHNHCWLMSQLNRIGSCHPLNKTSNCSALISMRLTGPALLPHLLLSQAQPRASSKKDMTRSLYSAGLTRYEFPCCASGTIHNLLSGFWLASFSRYACWTGTISSCPPWMMNTLSLIHI